jgi:tRNA threonylcarbamoyladenosine biosynthesis protein TsaB
MTGPDTRLLAIDASTPVIHAGVWSGGAWLSLVAEEGDAIRGVPEALRRALTDAGLKAADIGAIAHCEGPGALLGLRIAAMAVETLRATAARPIALLAYSGLTSFAIALAAQKGTPLHLATPLRRGSWNVCRSGELQTHVVEDAAMPALEGPLFIIPQRTKANKPAVATDVSYGISELPGVWTAHPGALRETERAECIAPLPSSYVLWAGERHRAPSGN